jgi:hypothetical protein
MKPRSRRLWVFLTGVLVLGACSDPRLGQPTTDVAPTPRKTVVWLTGEGIDAETATELAAVGVDQLVVRRGAILLSGGAPVVQLLPAPPVEGPIPTAVALAIPHPVAEGKVDAADAVWAALETDFGTHLPSEIILDFRELGEGTGEFVSRLAAQSGLAVIPILRVAQIETELGQAVAKAAHRCIVPLFGPQIDDLRGLDDLNTQPLAVRLAALSDLGVRVRVAVSLRPRTEPGVDDWAQDIDVLTDETVAEMKRASTLDRSFLTVRPLTWGGRSFGAGQTIAVAWVDAARLGLYLTDAHRTVLPEVEGWDLVSLPPVGSNLGLDREELIRYLGGEGPGPRIEIRLERSDRNLTVRLANTSVFRSAITGFANWVQVEVASGALVATSRGSFDRVILGSMDRGQWRPNPPGAPDAVRFVETYIAPGEELNTGSIRLPSSRSRVTVRWQVQLSDGSTISGVAE